MSEKQGFVDIYGKAEPMTTASRPPDSKGKLTCPSCGATELLTGVQYEGTPCDYDGVSEWCCMCGTRWGRWSNRILIPGELEQRYGR
jgi:hypothetical protein